MEILVFSLNAIFVYLFSDWIIRKLEEKRGAALKYRQPQAGRKTRRCSEISPAGLFRCFSNPGNADVSDYEKHFLSRLTQYPAR